MPKWRFFSPPKYLETVFFLLNSKGDASLQCEAYDYCQTDWDDLHSYLGDVLWHNTFQLNASTTTTEYSEWLQARTNACIPHLKNQVMAHLSLWFSTACTGVIAHRSHLLCLYSQNDSPASKPAHAIEIKVSVEHSNYSYILMSFLQEKNHKKIKVYRKST